MIRKSQIINLKDVMDTIDFSGAPVTDGMRTRKKDLEVQWIDLKAELSEIKGRFVDPINEWARKRRAPHVKLSSP